MHRKHDKLLTLNVSVGMLYIYNGAKKRSRAVSIEKLDGIGRLVLKFKRFASCLVWVCTIVKDFVCHERLKEKKELKKNK